MGNNNFKERRWPQISPTGLNSPHQAVPPTFTPWMLKLRYLQTTHMTIGDPTFLCWWVSDTHVTPMTSYDLKDSPHAPVTVNESESPQRLVRMKKKRGVKILHKPKSEV